MPDETVWEECFSGVFVKIYKSEPLFVFVSKAIKAKEKNLLLIKEALSIYGSELSNLIIKYGGDLNDYS